MNKWENEPDRHEWVDPDTRLQCEIRRVSHSGHLCGYVRIPEGHPLHGVSYSDPVPVNLKTAAESLIGQPVGKRGIIDLFCFDPAHPRAGILFDVHGGITYSKQEESGFWYGFDCAHAGDLCPTTAAKYGLGDGVYRDFEYVKAECESLARQINRLAKVEAL